MKPGSVLPRQGRCFLHQFLCNRKGAAGSEGDFPHRIGAAVVEAPDRVFTVAKDLLFGLHHGIRRQPPVLLGEAHRTPGGTEAHSERLGRLELDRHGIALDMVGIDVVMVGGEGAPRSHQLRHRQKRGIVDALFIEIFPDIVEERQPIEELGVLNRRMVSGQGLIKVVVGVYKPRQNDVLRTVDHPIDALGGDLSRRIDPAYFVVDDKQIGAVEGLLVEARLKGVNIFQQKRGTHAISPYRVVVVAACAAAQGR